MRPIRHKHSMRSARRKRRVLSQSIKLRQIVVVSPTIRTQGKYNRAAKRNLLGSRFLNTTT
jgi:hypothetical protein